jgi:hypothetical protein
MHRWRCRKEKYTAKYFVYHNDGYYDDGGVGIEDFNTQDNALTFIESRMRADPQRHLNNYLLVEGKVLVLKPVEVITKLTVVD